MKIMSNIHVTTIPVPIINITFEVDEYIQVNNMNNTNKINFKIKFSFVKEIIWEAFKNLLKSLKALCF